MDEDEASIQVNLSDTAVAGDVNITQSLQADTEEIVEKLVNQLDRFDINKPGLAVPEDGFSRLDVEAAIPLVREDMNILKGMTSPSLLQFGKLLDSMGWPKIAQRISKILLERDDVKSNPLWHARSHLIMSRSSGELFEHSLAIKHADMAAEIAQGSDLKEVEAYALYLSIDKRNDLSRDTSVQGTRTELLLELAGVDGGETGAWCHLALSRYLDAVNPDVAEHHEAMGFQHASNHNDLEAMVATLLATAENKIWTIKERFWTVVKDDADTNGLSSYSMLVDLANFVRQESKEQLLAGIRTLTRHAHGRDMKEMEHLSILLSAVISIQSMMEETNPGQVERQQRLSQILDEESTQIAFDEVLTRSYHGFDQALLYHFILLELSGTSLPSAAKGYLSMKRDFPNDSIKAMMLLYETYQNNSGGLQDAFNKTVDFLETTKLTADDSSWVLLDKISQIKQVQYSTPELPEHRQERRDNFAPIHELIISRRRLGIGTFVCMFGLLFVLNNPDFLSVWLVDHMVTSWSMLTLNENTIHVLSNTPRTCDWGDPESWAKCQDVGIFFNSINGFFLALMVCFITRLFLGAPKKITKSKSELSAKKLKSMSLWLSLQTLLIGMLFFYIFMIIEEYGLHWERHTMNLTQYSIIVFFSFTVTFIFGLSGIKHHHRGSFSLMRHSASMMNFCFLIFVFFMLSSVQTNVYDSYGKNWNEEGQGSYQPDKVKIQTIQGESFVDRDEFDQFFGKGYSNFIENCRGDWERVPDFADKIFKVCRYGSFDGEPAYVYIHISHYEEIEKNTKISSDLGLVIYIFVFGSWALLLFTKLNKKQTLANLVGSGVIISMLFAQALDDKISVIISSFVLGIMFYTQWVLPWKEEDPKEVHA
ncbi:MAG: hypothetical protein CL997_05055 [Euryarchaeota archaeon]|nr:hypothetical protein [Euryarchaeota archaeon]